MNSRVARLGRVSNGNWPIRSTGLQKSFIIIVVIVIAVAAVIAAITLTVTVTWLITFHFSFLFSVPSFCAA